MKRELVDAFFLNDKRKVYDYMYFSAEIPWEYQGRKGIDKTKFRIGGKADGNFCAVECDSGAGFEFIGSTDILKIKEMNEIDATNEMIKMYDKFCDNLS